MLCRFLFSSVYNFLRVVSVYNVCKLVLSLYYCDLHFICDLVTAKIWGNGQKFSTFEVFWCFKF